MRNFHTLTGRSARDLNDLQMMEQRVNQLEALVQEMRLEIELLSHQLRLTSDPHNQKRLEKMRAYQQQLDEMFSPRESA